MWMARSLWRLQDEHRSFCLSMILRGLIMSVVHRTECGWMAFEVFVMVAELTPGVCL